ncbi:TlpA disulfide reductase family protein [Shewanella dokdonensis]|uniref:TlpA disulfide reductase family protein n=1 Tax=Shewanella dokdonensis TaxID=712036 RepID=UPI00200C9178|nr:TlpA disulfide reductase family protein [Shewanella dokdonensis]MCL1075772.1 TlpA family protein disulfide reductase [Shewanella dokdonensis]
MKLLQSALFLGWALLAFASSAAQDNSPKAVAKASADSSVDKINILAHGFPLKLVPFTDAQGHSHDFAQYRGKVVLINMWATWCPPCVRELPALQRFEKKFDQSKFAFLPISIDQGGKQQVVPFLTSLGMPEFDSFYDPKMALDAIFPLDTIPATFILDGNGTLIAFVRSFVDWDDPQAEALINSFIEKEQQRQAEAKAATKSS